MRCRGFSKEKHKKIRKFKFLLLMPLLFKAVLIIFYINFGKRVWTLRLNWFFSLKFTWSHHDYFSRKICVQKLKWILQRSMAWENKSWWILLCAIFIIFNNCKYFCFISQCNVYWHNHCRKKSVSLRKYLYSYWMQKIFNKKKADMILSGREWVNFKTLQSVKFIEMNKNSFIEIRAQKTHWNIG